MAFSPADSFFTHDLRTAVCSRGTGRSCERVAVVENSVPGDCLYGVRADGGNAFQPAG
jgi:hypothetical protein